MNSLSNIAAPAFGDLSLRGAQPSDASARQALDFGAADTGALHVGPASRPRAIEDIERDFLSALCENRPA